MRGMKTKSASADDDISAQNLSIAPARTSGWIVIRQHMRRNAFALAGTAIFLFFFTMAFNKEPWAFLIIGWLYTGYHHFLALKSPFFLKLIKLLR